VICFVLSKLSQEVYKTMRGSNGTPNGSLNDTLTQVNELPSPQREQVKRLNDLIGRWNAWRVGPQIGGAVAALLGTIVLLTWCVKPPADPDPSVGVVPSIITGLIGLVFVAAVLIGGGWLASLVPIFKRQFKVQDEKIRSLISSEPWGREALEILSGMSWLALHYGKESGLITRDPERITYGVQQVIAGLPESDKATARSVYHKLETLSRISGAVVSAGVFAGIFGVLAGLWLCGILLPPVGTKLGIITLAAAFFGPVILTCFVGQQFENREVDQFAAEVRQKNWQPLVAQVCKADKSLKGICTMLQQKTGKEDGT
jgi:hypothetical protein